MEKPKFTKVSLDNYTYDLLGELAKAHRLKKSEYLRNLIRNEATKIGKGLPIGVPVPKPITGLVSGENIGEQLSEIRKVIQHEVKKAFKDMTLGGKP